MKSGALATGLAAAALAAGTMATPSMAQASPVIKIGLIDTSINKIPGKDRNVQIQSRDMTEGTPAEWIGESGYSHGELVAASAVKAARALSPTAPISIYAANIYSPETDLSRFGGGRVGKGLEDRTKIKLILNYKAAEKAIDWMKNEGVKVLVITATGSDSAGMRHLNEHAKEAGMIVVASTSNGYSRGPVFPAAYPNAISVAGDNRSLPISQDRGLAAYVSYVSDAIAPVKGAAPEIGSSFAAGTVGGLVATYAAKDQNPTEAGARTWLDARSTKAEYAGVSLSRVTYADYIRPVAEAVIDKVATHAAEPGPNPARIAAMQAGFATGR